MIIIDNKKIWFKKNDFNRTLKIYIDAFNQTFTTELNFSIKQPTRSWYAIKLNLNYQY